MRTARIHWAGGTPSLNATCVYEPERGSFFEPYSFSPDDRRILFTSDDAIRGGPLSPGALNAQVWTIDAADFGDLRLVSPPDRLGGPFSDYNEFAFYIPGTARILFARIRQAAAHVLDYWTANVDGSDCRRLTFMKQPGAAQYQGYSVGLGVAFDPRDPRRFVAGLSHDLGTKRVEAELVTIGRA